MPRMTSDEIDAEIVDAAAALFARFGFRQTSVQAIADEVGYSKAGLLHRFQTKEALREAVVADFRAQLEAVVAGVRPLAPGPDRDRAVFAALLDLTDRRRGFIPLMFSMLTTPKGDPDAEPLALLAASALEAFAVADPEQVDERATRVFGALGSLAITSLVLLEHPDARPYAVDAAMGALGHPRS